MDIKEEVEEEEDVDKCYFGILTYYVQIAAVMKIEIEFSDVSGSQNVLDKIIDYVDKSLNIELTQFLSFTVCPITGLTMFGRHMYNLVFLISIYVAWSMMFCFVSPMWTCARRNGTDSKWYGLFSSLRLKLINGLMEIIKYTYGGFCGIMFMSLVCSQLKSHYVWFDDASHVCLEGWQISMVIFGIFYIVPFPIILLDGMKLMKDNMISWGVFILSCLFPLAGLIYFAFIFNMKERETDNMEKVKDEELSEESETIIANLQGPYRVDSVHMTLYWEAMVSLRRLLIVSMTLIGYASIRMICIASLCGVFTVQHVYLMPFYVKTSNHLETVSLCLLTLVAIVNLLKASLTDSRVIPAGPSVSFFTGLEFMEKIMVLVLIAIIIVIELYLKLKNRKK